MRRVTAKVTSKGQITVPAEIREALGVKPGDRLAFVRDKSGVRVDKARSVVDETAGVFKKYFTGGPLSPRELKDLGEEAWVEDVLERDDRTRSQS